MKQSAISSLIKKVKPFLASFSIFLIVLNLAIFTLSNTNFLFGLDRSKVWRLSFWPILLALILNFPEIKAWFNQILPKEKQRKFLQLTLVNITLTTVFVLVSSIFQYGSPLIYENHPENFRIDHEITLAEGETISQEFRAASNNLGTVGIKIAVQIKTFAKNSKGEVIEIAENEQGTTDKEELSKPANIPPAAEIVFRIKEEGSDSWFYENTYYFSEEQRSADYQFGFPVQESSNGKKYLLELEGIRAADGESCLYSSVTVNDDNVPYLYTKYIYSKGEIKNNIKPILKNICNKIKNISEISYIAKLVTYLILSEISFCLVLKRGDKNFTQKTLPVFYQAFLFLLPTTIFIFFNSSFFYSNQIIAINNKSSSYEMMRFTILSILIFLAVTIVLQNKEKIFNNLKKVGKTNYFWIIFFLTIIGLVLRAIGFNKTGAVLEDEFSLLTSAEQYLREGEFQYARARSLVYVVAFLFKNLGPHSVFVARIPSIVCGALTIPLIYFLGKKINKNVGLISAYLWTFLPLAIGLSSYAREYSPYCFVICLSLLIFSSLFDLGNKSKKHFNICLFLTIILLGSIGYYCYRFGAFTPSTLSKFWFPIAGIFLLSLYFQKIIIYSNQNREKKIKIMVIAALILLATLLLATLLYNSNVSNPYLIKSLNSIRNNPNGETLKNIFFNPSVEVRNGGVATWFSAFSFSSFFLMMFLFLPLFAFRKNIYYVSFAATFFALYLSLAFMVTNHLNPRYVFYLFPFYVLSLSAAIFLFHSIISIAIKNKKGAHPLSLALFLVVFNPLVSIFLLSNQTTTTIYDKSKRNPLIGEPLRIWQNEEKIASYIESYQSKENFVVITNQPSLYYLFYSRSYNLKLANIYMVEWYEDSKYWLEKKQSLASLVEGNQNGLLIISNNKNIYVAPQNQYLYGKEVIYLESLGGYNIFNWNKGQR